MRPGVPFLRELPDDLCQCPHWVRLQGHGRPPVQRYEEAHEAGEAFSVPTGHSPVAFAGAEVVILHPTEELASTMAVMGRNLTAAREHA